MKNIYTFLFLFLAVSAMTAQKQVILNVDQIAGGEPLVTGEAYTTDADYDLNFTRLQYYISEIFLIHDGGEETKLEGLYILANALEDSSYDLGEVDLTNVERIRFHIGVDQQNNHADPALWPNGHPLALSFPTMHWGWAAGYRFAAVEGKAGRGLVFTYQVHALGDQHYGAVELDVTPREEGSQIHIDLVADYLELFDGLDVSFGLIEHSDAPKAAQLLTNLKEKVFTAASPTSSSDLVFEGKFEAISNPGAGMIRLSYEMPDKAEYSVNYFNGTGQLVDHQRIQGSGVITLEDAVKGYSYVSLTRKGQVLKTLKMVTH